MCFRVPVNINTICFTYIIFSRMNCSSILKETKKAEKTNLTTVGGNYKYLLPHRRMSFSWELARPGSLIFLPSSATVCKFAWDEWMCKFFLHLAFVHGWLCSCRYVRTTVSTTLTVRILGMVRTTASRCTIPRMAYTQPGLCKPQSSEDEILTQVCNPLQQVIYLVL